MAWDRLRTSYDHVAGAYEDKFLDELDGKPRDRELLAAFASAVSDPVIEIGCGPGQVGAAVRAGGRRVIGVDLSTEMVTRAATRLDSAAAADMRQLPFAAGTIGGVVAFYSVIHVRRRELQGVLDEFDRVLRPGGRVLFSAHEGHGDHTADEFLGQPVPFVATLFALDELTAATRNAGLDVVAAERRPPYPTESQTFRLYVEAEKPMASRRRPEAG